MSPLAKHFIENGIKLMQINEYLRSELVRAGFAGVDIQKKKGWSLYDEVMLLYNNMKN